MDILDLDLADFCDPEEQLITIIEQPFLKMNTKNGYDIVVVKDKSIVIQVNQGQSERPRVNGTSLKHCR